MSNGLLVATRKGRIPPGRALLFWDELATLPISAEPPLFAEQVKAIFVLCHRHNLTFYDAAYLELALRLRLPLATLDSALVRAARADGVLSVA